MSQTLLFGGGIINQRQLSPKIRAEVHHLLTDYIQHPSILTHLETDIVSPELGQRRASWAPWHWGWRCFENRRKTEKTYFPVLRLRSPVIFIGVGGPPPAPLFPFGNILDKFVKFLNLMDNSKW